MPCKRARRVWARDEDWIPKVGRRLRLREAPWRTNHVRERRGEEEEGDGLGPDRM